MDRNKMDFFKVRVSFPSRCLVQIIYMLGRYQNKIDNKRTKITNNKNKTLSNIKYALRMNI